MAITEEDEVPWWERSIAPAAELIGSHVLDIEIIVAGDGFSYPKPGNTVSIAYVGYLPCGRVFDTTYRRGL